jgi:hypothetical protein
LHEFDDTAFDLHVGEIHKLHAILSGQGAAHVLLSQHSTLKQSLQQTALTHLGPSVINLRLG